MSADRLNEISKKYYDEKFLIEQAKKGSMDVSERLNEIGKIKNIAEIIIALKQLELDLFCITRHHSIKEDDEYKEAVNEFMNTIGFNKE